MHRITFLGQRSTLTESILSKNALLRRCIANSAARHLETVPKRIKEDLRWKNELQFICASILRSLICFLDLRLIFKIQIPNFDWDSLFFSNIVCRTELIKIQIHFSKMVYNRKDASLELSRGSVLPRLAPNLRTTIWTLVNGRIFRPVARFTHDQLFCLENQTKQFTPDRISLKFSRCPTITKKPCMFRLLRRWFEPD